MGLFLNVLSCAEVHGQLAALVHMAKHARAWGINVLKRIILQNVRCFDAIRPKQCKFVCVCMTVQYIGSPHRSDGPSHANCHPKMCVGESHRWKHLVVCAGFEEIPSRSCAHCIPSLLHEPFGLPAESTAHNSIHHFS